MQRARAILSPALSTISHSIFTLLLWKLCYGSKTEGGDCREEEEEEEGLLTGGSCSNSLPVVSNSKMPSVLFSVNLVL